MNEKAGLGTSSFGDREGAFGAHVIPVDFWGLGSELESFFGEKHPGGTPLDKWAYLIHTYWGLPVPPGPTALDMNNDGVINGGDLGLAIHMYDHYGSELDWSLFDTPWT